MKKKLLFLISVFAIITLGTVALAKTTTQMNQNVEEKEDEIVIVTSFYPIYILTQNLVDGIDNVSVVNLTPAQLGCLHDYQLTTEDMKTLSNADIFIMNGGGMESFLDDVIHSYPDLTIIDSSVGIELLESLSDHDHSHSDEESEVTVEDDHSHDEEESEDDSDHDHSHDDEESDVETQDTVEEADQNQNEVVSEGDSDHDHDHDHDHGEYNGHIWLNMDNYMRQIDQVANGLVQADSTNSEAYLKNAADYKVKVAELKAEYENELQDIQNNQVIIFHDAFAYLAQQLGIEVVFEVYVEEDSALSAGDIKEVIDEINLHNIKVLMVEEQYKNSIAENISNETDATVYVIDSLVTGEDSKDAYLDGMRYNLEVLKTALYAE